MSRSEPDKLARHQEQVLNEAAAPIRKLRFRLWSIGKTGILPPAINEASYGGYQRQVQLPNSMQSSRSSIPNAGENNAKEKPIVGVNERIHESTKLAALFDLLVNQGIPSPEVLRGIQLTADAVASPSSKISLVDLMTACENAIRLSNDPHLPYRIGTSVHVSDYVMYGSAIPCCPDFRKTMTFAEMYHALAAPPARIEFAEENGSASWVIESNARATRRGSRMKTLRWRSDSAMRRLSAVHFAVGRINRPPKSGQSRVGYDT